MPKGGKDLPYLASEDQNICRLFNIFDKQSKTPTQTQALAQVEVQQQQPVYFPSSKCTICRYSSLFPYMHNLTRHTKIHAPIWGFTPAHSAQCSRTSDASEYQLQNKS